MDSTNNELEKFAEVPLRAGIKIDPSTVVYGEGSAEGAMGMMGNVWIYALVDGNLTRYQASVWEGRTKDGYDKAAVEGYNIGCKFLEDNVEAGLLTRYYGGAGNWVYVGANRHLVPQGDDPEKYEGYFTFEDGEKSYRIEPTVYGVFKSAKDKVAENAKATHYAFAK